MPTLDEKIRDFKTDLEKIDLRNVDYFLFERSDKGEGVRDCLANHWKFEMQGDKALFGFVPGSAVPFRIRKKCFARFGYYFPDGDVVGSLFNS